MRSRIDDNSSLVVIFGRTNVGKSTLFNCLIEKNKALVSAQEGTTRDSNIGKVNWQGESFALVDTGGIMNIDNLTKKISKSDNIDTLVQKQAHGYLLKAQLILFLVDTKTGLLPNDKKLSAVLKKILPSTENVLLVANKVDGPKLRNEIAEFNKLSLGEPIPISATTGSGTGDLLDIVINKIDKEKGDTENEREEKKSINITILGQPNVGKSSLVNAILGEDKIIVSPTPHTTREPQDTLIKYQGQFFNLIDTAGISKRGQKTAKRIKIKNTLEKKSITKSLASLKYAHIALLVIDLERGITHQDAKIVEEITNKGVSLIIVANKWDLIQERNTKTYTNYIYKNLPFITWVPIQFLSAKTGEKVYKILELSARVYEQRQITISDSALNKLLGRIVKKHRPTKAKGTKHPHIYEIKQINSNPPEFSIRIGSKDTIHFSYVRFIENRIREKFGFLGTPIYMKIIKKSL